MSNPNSGNNPVSIEADADLSIIIDIINNMSLPTAVLVFGVTCDFKAQVSNALYFASCTGLP